MFYRLTKKEINDFCDKYLPEWKQDIVEITRIDYNGVYEYLINGHYLLIFYKDKIVAKDLQ